MLRCPEIDATQAKQFLDEQQSLFVDIRDPMSYGRGHIPGAVPLDDEGLKDFLERTPKDRRVIVCCYHGNSSQGATAFLLDHGFQEVYSLQGGFEEWKQLYPDAKE